MTDWHEFDRRDKIQRLQEEYIKQSERNDSPVLHSITMLLLGGIIGMLMLAIIRHFGI
jgi:hypothetical protein